MLHLEWHARGKDLLWLLLLQLLRLLCQLDKVLGRYGASGELGCGIHRQLRLGPVVLLLIDRCGGLLARRRFSLLARSNSLHAGYLAFDDLRSRVISFA